MGIVAPYKHIAITNDSNRKKNILLKKSGVFGTLFNIFLRSLPFLEAKPVKMTTTAEFLNSKIFVPS